MSGSREPFTLDGGTVRLRPWRLRDAEQLRAACDDPVTAHFMAQMPTPYTMEHARWWITEGSLEAWQTGGASWAVVDPVTDEVLGGAGLGHLHEDRRQAEVGYWVAPWARRRGVATATTRAITGWAFGTLGVLRMELLTAPANAASQRVALAAGFTREGVRRGAAIRRDGSQGDFVVFVRLASDPPGPVPPGGVVPPGAGDVPPGAGAVPPGAGAPGPSGVCSPVSSGTSSGRSAGGVLVTSSGAAYGRVSGTPSRRTCTVSPKDPSPRVVPSERVRSPRCVRDPSGKVTWPRSSVVRVCPSRVTSSSATAQISPSTSIARPSTTA